ncbi:MAG: spinster family MFS transporter [Steroidobacteraceae bacterium]
MQPPAVPHWAMSRGYRGWVLAVLASVSTFGFIDRIVVQVLVQPIKAELHVSDADLGLLGGLTFAVLYVALSIPVARVAERRSRIAIVTVGTALWSLATAASGMAASFGQLLLARIGVGVGEATNGPATASIISDYFGPERRASAMSIYGLAVPLGAFLGGSVGGLVAQTWGWRAAFLCAGLPGLLLALLQGLTIREPPRGLHDPAPAGEPARTAAADATPSFGVPTTSFDVTPSFAAVLRRFWERRSLVQFIAGATLSTVAGYGINYFLAAYFSRRFGLDYAQAGLVMGIVSSVPAALSILAGGFLADWAGKRSARWYALIPALGAAFTAPLYMASFAAGTWLAAALLLALTAVCQYAYIPAAAAVTQNMMEPRMRASAAAVTGLVFTLLGQGLGPLFAGMLSDHFSRSSYAGDFALSCTGRSGATSAACAAAASHGLEIALTLFAAIYLWSAVHLWLASRRLTADLAR